MFAISIICCQRLAISNNDAPRMRSVFCYAIRLVLPSYGIICIPLASSHNAALCKHATITRLACTWHSVVSWILISIICIICLPLASCIVQRLAISNNDAPRKRSVFCYAVRPIFSSYGIYCLPLASSRNAALCKHATITRLACTWHSVVSCGSIFPFFVLYVYH